jgi:DnaJ like chaperone protein
MPSHWSAMSFGYPIRNPPKRCAIDQLITKVGNPPMSDNPQRAGLPHKATGTAISIGWQSMKLCFCNGCNGATPGRRRRQRESPRAIERPPLPTPANAVSSDDINKRKTAMSIWGKLAGAAAGLAVGGPIGALVGGVAGHILVDHDRSKASALSRQMTFTIGVIALGAKMAKADGHVTADEVEAFKEVFVIPDGEKANVARIFNMARQDAAGFEVYAGQLAGLFQDDRETLKDILDGLFHIAKADAVLHPGEERFLAEVARIFGFSETEFRRIRARHVVETRFSPYEVLGVEPSISDGELKAHYRKLLKQHHPDSLTARGVPEEFIITANRKTASINEAYEEIRRERHI